MRAPVMPTTQRLLRRRPHVGGAFRPYTTAAPATRRRCHTSTVLIRLQRRPHADAATRRPRAHTDRRARSSLSAVACLGAAFAFAFGVALTFGAALGRRSFGFRKDHDFLDQIYSERRAAIFVVHCRCRRSSCRPSEEYTLSKNKSQCSTRRFCTTTTRRFFCTTKEFLNPVLQFLLSDDVSGIWEVAVD